MTPVLENTPEKPSDPIILSLITTENIATGFGTGMSDKNKKSL